MEPHDESITDVTRFRKAGHSMCLTVPKGVCTALNWIAGQTLLVRAEGNRLVLESLAEHMANAVREHDQQIASRS